MVMSNATRIRPDKVPYTIEGLFKVIRGEEGKSLVCPLLSHIVLELQTNAPVYTTSTSPKSTHSHHTPVIFGDVDPAIIIEIAAGSLLVHGKLVWRKVISFVDDQDPVACFGQVLGTYTSAAARTNDDYVCLDGFDGFTCFELEELEIIAFDCLPIAWDISVSC